jgi:hypothetical protein
MIALVKKHLLGRQLYGICLCIIYGEVLQALMLKRMLRVPGGRGGGDMTESGLFYTGTRIYKEVNL